MAGGAAPYTWTLQSGALPNGISLTSEGRLQGQPTQAGSFPFVVSVSDQLGASDTAALTMTIASAPVNQPPVVTINGPASGSSFPAGGTVTLVGAASDAEDGNLSGQIAWQSSLDGPLGTGAQLVTNGLSVGSHTITATVSDSQGAQSIDTISVTIVSGPGGPTPVDFSGYSLVPVPDQDYSGGATVEDGGSTLRLVGNTWKRIAYPYVVTASTVIEFDYRRDQLGEVHGIGFDDGGAPPDMAQTTFALEGTQDWGIRSYRYSGTGDWVRFRIPVGQHYTGSFSNLVFVMDDDANGAGNERFRNLIVFDE